MKRAWISSVLLLMSSTLSFAADLSPPDVIPPALPGARWNGFYAGAQMGYAFGSDRSFTRIPPVPAVDFPGAAIGDIARPSGVTGGAHLGYTLPIGALLPGHDGVIGVLGAEGAADGSGYRKVTTFGVGNPYSLGVGSAETIGTGIQGAVRGRFGIAVDRILLYATGGAVFAEFPTSYNNVGTGFDSFSHTRAGYTLGGGVEYALTEKWSVRADYHRNDFGTFTDNIIHASPIPNSTVRHLEIQEQVQVGVSYRFNALADGLR